MGDDQRRTILRRRALFMSSTLVVLGGCSPQPATSPGERPPIDIPEDAPKIARTEFEQLAFSVNHINKQLDAAFKAIPARCNFDDEACAGRWRALGKLLQDIDPGILHFPSLCQGDSEWAQLHAEQTDAHLAYMQGRRAKLADKIAERLTTPEARAKFDEMREPDPMMMVQVCLSCAPW